MTELDKWFPRDDKPKPKPEKPPEQGVIDGVRRKRPRRFVKQSRIKWRRKRKERDDGN